INSLPAFGGHEAVGLPPEDAVDPDFELRRDTAGLARVGKIGERFLLEPELLKDLAGIARTEDLIDHGLAARHLDQVAIVADRNGKRVGGAVEDLLSGQFRYARRSDLDRAREMDSGTAGSSNRKGPWTRIFGH